MPNLKLELPPGFIVINTDKITPNIMERLASGLSEVRAKNSVYEKYPMLEGETQEDWSTRVTSEFLEDNKKKDGESMEDFIRRVNKVDTSKKSVIFETLQMIADTFGQKDKVTLEVFGNSSYSMVKAFIRDVLSTCDFDVRDYE